MKTMTHRLIPFTAAACAVFTLASTAHAVDLRSWDQKLAASKRFVVLPAFGDQAVLDKETQLVWERAPDPALRSWYYADHNRCGITPIGGRFGWRLPSRFELMTLGDPAVLTDPRLPAGHPFIGIGPNARFYTSSRSTDPSSSVDNMLAVHTAVFNVSGLARDVLNGGRAWCIRGAGSPDGY